MKFKELVVLSKKYSNVIFLNIIFPIKLRKFFINLSLVVIFVDVLLLTLSQFDIEYTFFISKYINIILIDVSIAILFFIFFYSLHLYSRYFVLNSIIRIFNNNKKRFVLSYEAGVALVNAKDNGFVKGLLSASDSKFIMNRLLISPLDINVFCENVVILEDVIVPEFKETVTLGSLWKLLYESNEEFRSFLISRKIQKEIYYDTCDWLDRNLEDEKVASAWWWRENLSKTRGIAKSLSYGSVNFITKFARELSSYSVDEEVGKILLHKESVTKLEEVLSKTHGTNAVIIGGEGTGRHTIVKLLAKMIDQGDCYTEIEHKRVFEFDNSLLSSLDSTDLINVFNRCFEEAAIAKNIIFVINDFSIVYDNAQKQGVDLFQQVDRYISHENVSVVCVCDQSFYQNEKHKVLFDADFEPIHVEEMNSKLLIPYIQDHAIIIERNTGKFFPSSSINTIALSLNKYFIEESPLIKTNELLYKIAMNNHRDGNIVLDEESVSDTIKSMTGISTGEIQTEEKEKLLNLENVLHKKVMGQNEAIKIVSGTMRRSRAGLVSNTKPIGSFLFLGPTGVGKTETAKALAEVFFGNEEHMSRIDMNEYTANNSSNRLLGNEEEEGDLARSVHNRPYGVLLLDEFEKATTNVKDIFLRVLDEGVFTNGGGKIVSARTQIIIATSNAGSDYIRESGLSPDSTKDEINNIKTKLIDKIVSDGLFRVELINRFDAVVLFHPLGEDSRILIAHKLLEELRQRILLQGYDVSFTDALIRKVLGNDDDVMYGGRAIQRNIQTEVEEAIAKKIIEDNLQSGNKIILDVEDLN